MSIGYLPKGLGREAPSRAAALEGEPVGKEPVSCRSAIPVSKAPEAAIPAYKSQHCLDVVFEQDIQPRPLPLI
jgi:hypothetical protein